MARGFFDKCDLGIEETAKRIVMQCPFFKEDRKLMIDEMVNLGCEEINDILNEPANFFWYLMGKHPQNVDFRVMYSFWIIAAIYPKYTRGPFLADNDTG